MVLVVLDGGVLDAQAEAVEEVVEVVPVLVVLGLGEDDEAAAVGDVALDGVQLVIGEAGRAGAGGCLPPGVGWVGDDQEVGVAELRGERAGGVVEDLEIALGEGVGGGGEGGVAGVRGLHALGEVGADRPRLGVELVENDAGKLRLLGHGLSSNRGAGYSR